MKRIDELVLFTFLASLIVNLVSYFLISQLSQFTSYLTVALFVAMILWGTFRFISFILQYLQYGRYAVLIYFLNKNNELLLIKNPYHGRFIPPGGRLKLWEFPHMAVSRKLKEEAGISDFEYHPQFHKLSSSLKKYELVEEVQRPYMVTIEHRKQKGNVRLHYDFTYICRFPNGDDKPLKVVEKYNPRWMSLEEIYKLENPLRPFHDAIDCYENLLQSLKSRSSTSNTSRRSKDAH